MNLNKLLFCFPLAFVAACDNKPSTVAAPDRPTVAAPVAATAANRTASSVLEAFKAAGLPVADVKKLTAATDDNQLLGRPHQYTSKLFFYDARHPAATNDVAGENTIEAFDNAADATARGDYVERMTKDMPMLLQYQMLRGNVLVRLNKGLLPAEVAQYRSALESLPL